MIVKDKKTGRKKDIRLPKRFKEKWISALRSGDYKQGQNQLHNDITNTYCCLGVACKIVDPKIKCGHSGLIATLDRFKKLNVPEVIKGHSEPDEADFNPIVKKLTEMNDNDKDFKYIANWIKRNL